MLANSVIAADTNGSAPDELRLNPNNQGTTETTVTPSNQQQNEVQPNNEITTLDDIDRNKNGNNFNNYNQHNLDGDETGLNNLIPSPFNFFGTRPNLPPMGPSPFLNIFGNMLEPFRRGHEAFEKQFRQLEQQAGEGQEVTSFTKNGVTYVRTCTTRRA